MKVVDLGPLIAIFVTLQVLLYYYSCCYEPLFYGSYSNMRKRLSLAFYVFSISANLGMPIVFLFLAQNNYNVLTNEQNNLIQSSKLDCNVTLLSHILVNDRITYFIELQNNNVTSLVTGDCTTNCIIFNNNTDCWMVDGSLVLEFPADNFSTAQHNITWGIVQLVFGILFNIVVICVGLCHVYGDIETRRLQEENERDQSERQMRDQSERQMRDQSERRMRDQSERRMRDQSERRMRDQQLNAGQDRGKYGATMTTLETVVVD